MGLDLVLLPLRNPEELKDVSVFCFDRLGFDRDYEIFGQLTDSRSGQKPTIKANPIPPQMWINTHDDGGMKRGRDDHYGTELTFVYAHALKKLKVPDDASSKNKAIKAFVDALPDDTHIILQWR